MAIDDNWGEALRKSAEQLTTGSKAETIFRVKNYGVDDSGNHQDAKVDANGSQYSVITSPSSYFKSSLSPYGIRVQTVQSTIFYDDFTSDSLDRTNRWITTETGGGAIDITDSTLDLFTGTTAGAAVTLKTRPLFLRPGFGNLAFGASARFEAPFTNGALSFMGMGVPTSSPTATNAIQDGVGFEVDVAGVLKAVIYKNGVATFSQALTLAADSAFHVYYMETRADYTFWWVDAINTPVAVSFGKNPSVSQLPILILEINDTVSPPLSAPNFEIAAILVGDTSAQNKQISDPQFPWRRAGVDINGNLRTSSDTDQDIFGAQISLPRVSQVMAQFDLALNQNDVAQTVTSTGVISQGSGLASLATGTGVTSSARIQSGKSVRYSPGRGLYATFTAVFTTPTHASSFQRIGYYDDSNGLFIGYNGLNFGVTVRSGGVDTFTAYADFNNDPLNGDAYNSRFTSGGVVQAVDFTKINIFKIEWGYLGAAPMEFKILNPDGGWITFHHIRYPNTASVVNVQNPNLPMRAEVGKTSSDATSLILKSGSWDAGTVEDSKSFVISDFKSRRHVHESLALQTSDQTIYTVSTGRTLHVTTIIFGVANDSTTVLGQVNIRDGAGGTIKLPMSVVPSTNQSQAGNNITVSFPVPMKFTTSFYVDILFGTITYSVTFVGYEAEI